MGSLCARKTTLPDDAHKEFWLRKKTEEIESCDLRIL
jgi:hypothetical protein